MWFNGKKESDNDASGSRKSNNTSTAYPPRTKADWRDVEVHDDKDLTHLALATDTFALCYDISQTLGTAQPDENGDMSYFYGPYSRDYRTKYEHDIICVTCSSRGKDQNGQSASQFLDVTYKPKEAEVLSVAFSINDGPHMTIMDPRI